ncbi:MAG: RNA polymerase sigma factor FliA [Kangiellaceae bacterium]|jgi:RNA polymerase sigma factor for flagellar operon FliA|nr:RNA polymerase sigma factor FliA [Kangiellaceae bacterium]|tara:strand:+ start:8598 stop:9299 length:702 start_codon:yes stop_codon:yes gene_type:complete
MYTEAANERIEKLVVANASLVKKIALHIKGRLPDHVQLDDLIQAGMVGLIEAARNFDPTKGASFETYAGIRIQGAIIDETRRGDWVPRSVHRNARLISQAIEKIEQETGRDAQPQEVADALGVSLDDYWKMSADVNSGHIFELDQDDARQWEENTAGDEDQFTSQQVEQDKFKQALAEAIKTLPEREKLVLALYYDEELNLKEIGAVLGVSESRVSQIMNQTALRLRARLKGW